MLGSILEVSVRTLSVALNADTTAGATSIVVARTDNVPPSGSLDIGDGSAAMVYTAVNYTTNTITLTLGTPVNLLEGDILTILPLVQEKWATVELQQDDDAVFALVPHGLGDRIPEGVRDPETQEYVVVDQQQGDWVIVDVLGTQPSVQADSIQLTNGSELALTLADLAAEVAAHDSQIAQNTSDIENVSETATDAGSLASIANISVTLSDYEPAAGDALGRREGSMWFTRTRARINYVQNPSFETNVTGWTTSQLSTTRESTPVVISGSWSCKLTNSGVSGPHRITWDNGGTRQVAVPGQPWAGSVYAAAVSGVNIGVFAELVWYDSGGSILSTSPGSALTLNVDDYQRLSAIDVAPANTASVALRVTNPTGSESAVWRIDGALLEVDSILGRYFDGRSYDGSWQGTADASASQLSGNRIVKIWELDDGAWDQKMFTGTALYDIDAGTVLYGTMDGERIADYSLAIDKVTASPVVASEALTAGDLVGVHNSAGLFRIRKADADLIQAADGFVLTDVANGAVGFMVNFGYNPFVTGLSPGIQYLSTVAGKCSSSPPSAAGTIHQKVGTAAGATVLNFTYNPPVKIL